MICAQFASRETCSLSPAPWPKLRTKVDNQLIQFLVRNHWQRPTGLLQGRYFGSAWRNAWRPPGQDHHLDAGLDPRLCHSQGIQEVAGPAVSLSSDLVAEWDELIDATCRQCGPASRPAQLAQIRQEPQLGLVPLVAEGQAPAQRRSGWRCHRCK